MSNTPPEGFREFPTGLGFNDAISPIYVRRTDDDISLGFTVLDKHCNMMGICHGGVMMTLMDIAMSFSIGFYRGFFTGSPTLGIQVDFINKGQKGQWLQTRYYEPVIRGKVGYARCDLMGPEAIVMRAQGSFSVPPEDEAAKLVKTPPDWLAKS